MMSIVASPTTTTTNQNPLSPLKCVEPHYVDLGQSRCCSRNTVCGTARRAAAVAVRPNLARRLGRRVHQEPSKCEILNLLHGPRFFKQMSCTWHNHQAVFTFEQALCRLVPR